MNMWPENDTQFSTSASGAPFLIRSGFIKRFKCSFSYHSRFTMTMTTLTCRGHHYRGIRQCHYLWGTIRGDKNLPNQVVIITLRCIVKYLISVISLLFCHMSVKVSPYCPFQTHSLLWKNFYSTLKSSLFIDRSSSNVWLRMCIGTKLWCV